MYSYTSRGHVVKGCPIVFTYVADITQLCGLKQGQGMPRWQTRRGVILTLRRLKYLSVDYCKLLSFNSSYHSRYKAKKRETIAVINAL
jgi:hypothetical protein